MYNNGVNRGTCIIELKQRCLKWYYKHAKDSMIIGANAITGRSSLVVGRAEVFPFAKNVA